MTGVALGVVTACGGNSFVAGAGDASSVTGPSADGGPSFCAIEGGAATFCDDFDELPLTSKWTAIDQTNGATIAKDESTFVSAPSSLESVVPVSLGLSSQRGRVEKAFGNASRIAVSLQLHIDAVAPKPTTGGTSLLLVQLGTDTLGISANNSEVTYFEDEVADGGDTNLVVGDIVSTQNVLGQWVPATLDIDIKNATMTASVNGNSVGPIEIDLPAGAGQSPLLYVGVQSKNATLMLESHYDNVLVNVTP